MKASAVAFFLLAPILASCQTPVWGQCGGIGFNGNKQCQSGNYCRYQNDWYSQCIPGSDPNGQPQQPTTTSTSTQTPTSTPPTSTSSVPTSTGGTTQPTGGVAIPSTAAGSLNEKARVNKNRYFGTATDQNTLSVSQLQSIVKSEFGVVTPENSMKMDTMQSSRGSFNFGGADYLVNFAQQNNKLVRGHTLVWHSQLPQWVKNINNRNDLISVIETHVSTVMGRYKGKIFHWDVVNEIFEEDGSFRRSVYYNVLGEEFVSIAFRAARKADPDCILFINDYNLDYEGPKLNAMVSLVNKLRAQGVPIDGIGSQAHLIVGNGAVGATPAALSKLHSTGALVAITELDIRIAGGTNSAKYEQQAKDYTTVVNACLSLARCVGISVWGVDDGHSWIPGTFPGEDDGLLWNRSYQKKPAYNAVSAALN